MKNYKKNEISQRMRLAHEEDLLLKDRQTSVDTVFEYLYDEIVSLRLLPGDSISEARIAQRFGISRQPVRDAFRSLENLDLLLIRPQRATEVRRFSIKAIETSRFLRASVEAEVIRRAVVNCDREGAQKLDICIDKQRNAMNENNYKKFNVLDYEFHQQLCKTAKVDFASDIIASEKAKTDRLCMLGLTKEARMPELIDDHAAIATAVKQGHTEKAVELGLIHLSRLDETIKTIHENNPNYFEP